jgi:hypothetical protein
MTLKATLSRHLERIPLVELSKTFQDAIRISRELGERYLWIDSLCILQDDPQDWEEEAAKMHTIYGGATLTIAALSAEDGRGGCRLDLESGSFVDVNTGFAVLQHGMASYQHEKETESTTSINDIVPESGT